MGLSYNQSECGDVKRFKALRVALGHWQTYGVDYHEMYPSVANVNLIRTLLTVCCHDSIIIHQYVVNTAFINVVYDVYMDTPKGFDMQQIQVL